MDRYLSNEEIKRCELDILRFFHNLCEENYLRYYLAYGTLLGAVRHKGFIPWDDDIDVFMPRQDFEIMQNLVPNDGIYKLLSLKTDETYSVPFAKLVDSRTILKQSYNFVENTELGLYIDIFILDGVPTNSSEARAHSKGLMTDLRKWYWANTGFNETNSFIKNLLRYLITSPYRAVGPRKYVDFFQKRASKYSFDDCYLVADYSGLDPEIKCSYLKKNFEPAQLIEFEKELFYAPADVDEVLTRSYGDYMTLPSEMDQKSIHSFTVKWR